jgi:hypothetical protein
MAAAFAASLVHTRFMGRTFITFMGDTRFATDSGEAWRSDTAPAAGATIRTRRVYIAGGDGALQ